MQEDEYRKLAQVEDSHWFFKAMHSHLLRELTRAALPGRILNVLDAGCGTGGLIRRLSLKRPEWTYEGVDISPVACSCAQERTGAKIAEASLEKLPFGDESYEAVTSADVLCQVEDPAKAVSELFRILRPGGFVVLNLPAHPWLYSYHDKHCGNLRRYSRRDIRQLLSEAGFRGIQVSSWNCLAFPALVIRRKFMKPRPTTDVEIPSQFTQYTMSFLMALELFWIDSGFRLPFGSSYLVIARKPLAGDQL